MPANTYFALQSALMNQLLIQFYAEEPREANP
jgi:hypothetical protein